MCDTLIDCYNQLIYVIAIAATFNGSWSILDVQLFHDEVFQEKITIGQKF